MGGEGDYGGEYQDRNRPRYRFQGGSSQIGKKPRRPEPENLTPVEEGFYTPGEATAEADRVLSSPSWEMSEQEQQQQIAFAEAIPVIVIGGVVLIAAGSVLLLQVEDDNGQTVTINEYASRL